MTIIKKNGKCYVVKAKDEIVPARILDLKSIAHAIDTHVNNLSDMVNGKKNVYSETFKMKTDDIIRELELNAEELLKVCKRMR